MHFEMARPHEALRDWVRYYWRLDAPPGFNVESEPVVPDGAFELVLHLGDPPEQKTGDLWACQAREILVGEIQRPTLLRAANGIRCVGVHFAPGGVAAFFEEPADRLVDRVTPLDSVERPFPSLLERMGSEVDLEGAARILDAFLIARLRRRLPDIATRTVVGRIESGASDVTIEQLAFDAGVSTRQLQRTCDRSSGSRRSASRAWSDSIARSPRF